MNAMRGLYGDLFGEIGRLQQDLDQLFRPSGTASIRSMPRRTFPVINVGNTPDAVEVLALAPGVDPKALQITVDRGVLVIAGERKTEVSDQSQGAQGEDVSVYAQERFNGSFRRVISLPDDVDASRVDATCRDGLLRVRVPRREAAKPRRIEVS